MYLAALSLHLYGFFFDKEKKKKRTNYFSLPLQSETYPLKLYSLWIINIV